PGRASDRIVLVVDALAWLRPYFARCRVLTTYYVPYHVPSDFTGLDIGVCTGPHAGWQTLWPHLRNYGSPRQEARKVARPKSVKYPGASVAILVRVFP